MSKRQGFTWIEVSLVLGLLVLGALLALSAYKPGVRDKGDRTTCSGNLRQLALAAIQYSDDKRFFPHVTRLQLLDGDFQDGGPTTTLKSIRALLWYGYQDNPEDLICPTSLDLFRPVSSAQTKGNLRTWFWGGEHGVGSLDVAPFSDGLPDPSLVETDELSYGWTRKGMNRSTRSTSYVGADRSVRIESELEFSSADAPGLEGNHTDGWNVAFADASVEWYSVDAQFGGVPVTVPADMLTTTGNNSHGFLAIRDQSSTLGAGS